MVFKLLTQCWGWLSILIACGAVSSKVFASEAMQDAQRLYSSGQYFKSARYAFAALEDHPSESPQAYALITLGLTQVGMYQSASYFFIRTLQSGNNGEIRSVLRITDLLLSEVGPDLLRKYLVKYTNYDDYDSTNRGVFLYSLGKELLLSGQEKKALEYLDGVPSRSWVYPYALQIKATALTFLGAYNEALRAFEACADLAKRDDLEARCQAGKARVYYEMGKFEKADAAYDDIAKKTFVWTDIVFEQAWNSFALKEYNRTLGKLVTYRSPSLQFVHNPEIEVLRAQTYLLMCLYEDANQEINDFNRRFGGLGKELKNYIERNQNRLSAFYQEGKDALGTRLHRAQGLTKVLNRFVRGPYFRTLVESERVIDGEKKIARAFSDRLAGAENVRGQGFQGFIDQILEWRKKTVTLLGGAFIKNSMMDYYQSLINQFEKMAFIKLEMLSRSKTKLILGKTDSSGRERGGGAPSAKDAQYFWNFNGEFWNDELGDYVFALGSKCDS